MTTHEGFRVDTTARNLTAAYPGATDDLLCQNVGGVRVEFANGATAPGADVVWRVCWPGDYFIVPADAATPTWVRTPRDFSVLSVGDK